MAEQPAIDDLAFCGLQLSGARAPQTADVAMVDPPPSQWDPTVRARYGRG